MNINHNIPFYSNTADNVHCVQASMKMVCESFLPGRRMSFDEWDIITAHKPNLWTWTMAGLIWFQENNFEVINIELLDYERFSKEGGGNT